MHFNKVTDYCIHFSNKGCTSIHKSLQKLEFIKTFVVTHTIIYFLTFSLYELYFIYNNVHKVQVTNKVQKVRTSQPWFV